MWTRLGVAHVTRAVLVAALAIAVGQRAHADDRLDINALVDLGLAALDSSSWDYDALASEMTGPQ